MQGDEAFRSREIQWQEDIRNGVACELSCSRSTLKSRAFSVYFGEYRFQVDGDVDLLHVSKLRPRNERGGQLLYGAGFLLLWFQSCVLLFSAHQLVYSLASLSILRTLGDIGHMSNAQILDAFGQVRLWLCCML